ncbi:MAG TPA: 50S ribosomal protein L35 [bacterium]|nr:50S ribosomal protein L35 [bacterium]
MPKAKSHSGAKKRLSRTGTGKIKYAHAFKSHLLTHKKRDRKRRLKQTGIVGSANIKYARKLIPYK